MNKFLFNNKKIISFVIVVSLLFTLFSCDNKQLISYDIEPPETTAAIETTEFSFERKIATSNVTRIITKSDRDRLLDEQIKVKIAGLDRKPVSVKGIYLPAYVAGKEEKMDEIIEHIKETEINAVVIDVKDDIGRIIFKMDGEIIKKLGTNREIQIEDMPALMKKLKDNNIYTIARIASLRDNFAPRQDTSFALVTDDGKLYRDNTRYYWMNPYNKEVWDYLLEIGKGCIDAGFDEVQYDYCRFSTERKMRHVVYDEKQVKNRSKIEIITEMVIFLYQGILDMGGFVSIDVFGSIISSYGDQAALGQDYVTLLKYSDYLSPMVYPSHYGNGYFGIEVPDKQPYDTVKKALELSTRDTTFYFDTSLHNGIVRPWLQGFTATYLPDYIDYNEEEIRAQIQAVYDSGYNEWLIWNPSGVYKWDAFEKVQ